jgi:putative nucleotidyltransferase with HDIG domain
MYVIRDPIHGLIKISEKEKKIIDQPIFQRLRRIKQLSVEYLVYPSATHTRFEHSLGVMELSGKMASVLKWNVEEARLAGLLHDIGHIAFSHSGEKLLPLFGFENHEDLGKEMLEAMGIGLGEEEYLVSFDYGSDRMDYLVRDAYHTGTAYGIIEYDTIIRNLVSKD